MYRLFAILSNLCSLATYFSMAIVLGSLMKFRANGNNKDRRDAFISAMVMLIFLNLSWIFRDLVLHELPRLFMGLGLLVVQLVVLIRMICFSFFRKPQGPLLSLGTALEIMGKSPLVEQPGVPFFDYVQKAQIKRHFANNDQFHVLYCVTVAPEHKGEFIACGVFGHRGEFQIIFTDDEIGGWKYNNVEIPLQQIEADKDLPWQAHKILEAARKAHKG